MSKQSWTTRQYDLARGVRSAVGAASAATALGQQPSGGVTREVRILANTRCWLNFGLSGVTATVGATSFPVAADSPEVIIVPADATHFAVIRDSADGFVTLTPVA